jgi:tRNA(fMet)-specific endonuclease VapC
MLDTDTVSYVLRKRAPVCDRVMHCRPSDLCISSISLAELRFGAEDVNSPKLHNLIDRFVSSVEVLPFDELAATYYGNISVVLKKAGEPIGELDTLLAAHALSRDLVFVSNNTKHFRRIKGLKLENWS